MLGCDIVQISRFKKKVRANPSILEKVFHPCELENDDSVHLAGLFALKEATIKSLGRQAGDWLNLLISHQRGGRPVITDLTTNKVLETVSISHDGDYAFAVILADKL